MKIKDLFQKDITRGINGVVKADQLDSESVWQELDEFVVTRELGTHLRKFFEQYAETIGSFKAKAENNGVWVSGFFGSGKSHFIKVLSYLLENRTHEYNGQSQQALAFFEDKITDATVLADIKRSLSVNTDVILFNIDSKADSNDGRDAILSVFLKVFNERLGYCGEHPHIAHMERYLDQNSQYAQFKEAFLSKSGSQWEEERDAYEFNRDEVVAALSETLGQSTESCEKWVDNADETFRLTVENFAGWVKEYLEQQEDWHRVIFLVDEVGQFIGKDTALMLNLQTITEELGTQCGGNAWVVVTSQEDVEKALGETVEKSNDFSKIQGRFKTRLSLTSLNVDEVIQKRLLEKSDTAVANLTDLYKSKGDILRNQLSFRDLKDTYKEFREPKDFVVNYPFVPYQFELLQGVFTSIRKAGVTGLHLASGERSLLDAFQLASKELKNTEVGVLAPLYLFYPSIESFLDTSVKRTIDRAAEKDLQPFDVQILQVLFLIRYVDQLPGNVDNLVTLCIDTIDADRLSLKKKIEDGLERLLNNSLISRNADVYQFLTNEEQDIHREIKKIVINSADEAKELGNLIFRDVLQDKRKHRYVTTKKDIPFNRICDSHPVGQNTDGDVLVEVISPLSDQYESLSKDQCTLLSSQDQGKVVLKLPDKGKVLQELSVFLKTQRYLKSKGTSSGDDNTSRILRQLATENQQRRKKLGDALDEQFVESDAYISGAEFKITQSNASKALDGCLEYLIENTYTKMEYLSKLQDKPAKEINAIVRADDLTLLGDLPEVNPKAMDDLRNYIGLKSSTDQQIVVRDLCTVRYAGRPYGWPEMETALLLAKLYKNQEINLISAGEAVAGEKVITLLSESKHWAKVTITPRKTVSSDTLKNARKLGQDLFAKQGPDNEDGLYEFLLEELSTIASRLQSFASIASGGAYPGGTLIDGGRSVIKGVTSVKESNKFLERFLEHKTELVDCLEDYELLNTFYTHQKPIWDAAQQQRAVFQGNATQLNQDDEIRRKLSQFNEILEADAPYGRVSELGELQKSIQQKNDILLSQHRKISGDVIDAHIDAVEAELDRISADDDLRNSCLAPLTKIKIGLDSQHSVAHLEYAKEQAEQAKDSAFEKIVQYLESDEPGVEPPAVKVPTKLVVSKLLEANQYLETTEDVEAFLKSLREALEEAIANEQRVEIR